MGGISPSRDYAGSDDAFLAKLSADGAALTYFTFLGSSGVEGSSDVAVDDNEVAYLTGYTNSADFPVTAEAYQPNYNGNRDAFLTTVGIPPSDPVDEASVSGAGFSPGCTGCPAENCAPSTQASTDNPIDTRTGNLAYYSVDLSLPTLSGDLFFRRSIPPSTHVT